MSKRVVLLWNPALSDWEREPVGSLDHDLRVFWRKGSLETTWTAGWAGRGEKSPVPGDGFYLLRTDSQKPGLVGAGEVLSAPSLDQQWSGKPMLRIRFDYLVDYRTDRFLSRGELKDPAGGHWRYLASAMLVAPEVAARVDALLAPLVREKHPKGNPVGQVLR